MTPHQLSRTHCAGDLWSFAYAAQADAVIVLDSYGQQCLWPIGDERMRAIKRVRIPDQGGKPTGQVFFTGIAGSGAWGIVAPNVDPALALLFSLGKPRPPRQIRPFLDPDEDIFAVRFISDERRILFLSDGGALTDWSRVERRILQRLETMKPEADVFLISDDASVLILGWEGIGFDAWDLASGQPLALPQSMPLDILAVAFVPGERNAAFIGRSGAWGELQLPLSGEPSLRTVPIGLSLEWARIDPRSRTALISDARTTSMVWVEPGQPARVRRISETPMDPKFGWAVWSSTGDRVTMPISYGLSWVMTTSDGELEAELFGKSCQGLDASFGPGRSLLTRGYEDLCLWTPP